MATVHGTGRYRVRLTGSEDGVLDGECICPYGQEGNFCKHCVAVGLHLLTEAGSGDEPGARGGRERRGVEQVDVKTFLTMMDHAELVELVWQQRRVPARWPGLAGGAKEASRPRHAIAAVGSRRDGDHEVRGAL